MVRNPENLDLPAPAEVENAGIAREIGAAKDEDAGFAQFHRALRTENGDFTHEIGTVKNRRQFSAGVGAGSSCAEAVAAALKNVSAMALEPKVCTRAP